MLNLLRLKNWQIFWLIAGVHLVPEGLSYGVRYATDFRSPLIGQFATITSLFCLIVWLLWLYAAASFLRERMPAEQEMNLPVFKTIFSFYLFLNVISFVFPPVVATLYSVNSDIYRYYSWVLISISVIALITTGYLCYFVARCLAYVELQKETYLNDFIGDFFLFVFYPIGIWWIQPRLNKIFDDGPALDPNAPLDHNLRDS